MSPLAQAFVLGILAILAPSFLLVAAIVMREVRDIRRARARRAARQSYGMRLVPRDEVAERRAMRRDGAGSAA